LVLENNWKYLKSSYN